MSDETKRSEGEGQEAPQASRPARSSLALGLAAGFALGLTGCHGPSASPRLTLAAAPTAALAQAATSERPLAQAVAASAGLFVLNLFQGELKTYATAGRVVAEASSLDPKLSGPAFQVPEGFELVIKHLGAVPVSYLLTPGFSLESYGWLQLNGLWVPGSVLQWPHNPRPEQGLGMAEFFMAQAYDELVLGPGALFAPKTSGAVVALGYLRPLKAAQP